MSKLLNLSDAAKVIGISRPTLYTYFDRYPPMEIGGHPVLSIEQVRLIKAERKPRKNGKKAA